MNETHWKVFYWDFFGPHAEGTARHFQIHLEEFLAREQLMGCQTGVETAGGNHYGAWCKTPPALVEVIERSLRPKRSLEVEADDGGELEV